MGVAKITISIPKELLVEVDEEAEAMGESRSFVMREATATYLGRKRADEAAQAHYDSVQRAIEGMRRIRKLPSRDPRPTLEILRELRENDGFVTPLPNGSEYEAGGHDE